MSAPNNNQDLYSEIYQTLDQPLQNEWDSLSNDIPSHKRLEELKTFALKWHEYNWYLKRIQNTNNAQDDLSPHTDIYKYSQASTLNKIKMLQNSYDSPEDLANRYQDFLDSKW